MTTPVITGDPIGVWDASDADWPRLHAAGASEWARKHLEHVDRTYRIEFYLLDTPYAVIRRFAEDENGNLRLDLDAEAPMRDEPVVQVLTELPPEHLLPAKASS